jgi:hypothetical protein
LQPEPTFAAGLSLGLCEMAVWDLNAAAATMVRLSPLAPQRWEPIYNLGVIRALQGDLDGARAAEAALRPRNAEMADALLSRYIVPGSAPPRRTLRLAFRRKPSLSACRLRWQNRR